MMKSYPERVTQLRVVGKLFSLPVKADHTCQLVYL